MSNKAVAFWACIICLAFSVFVPVFLPKQEQHTRYHQHISAKLRPEDEVDDGSFNSHLPLLLIDTAEEIPGTVAIDPKTGEYLLDADGNIQHTMAEDGEETIHADLKVIDHQDRINRPTDEAEIASDIEIRVRGNSSRAFEKKNYYIRLKTAEGIDRNEPMLGMDAHHEWALHGPILDKTMIRNYMWYNIAGEIMDYAPNVRFCEVMINGEYNGLYVLTETITAGSKGSRLPLTQTKDGNTFTGYLLRMDRIRQEEKALNSFSGYTMRRRQKIEIKYPGEENLTPFMEEQIRQDFSDFEKAIYSYDFDSPKWGYRRLIDSQSFADYFIINEITSNYDAGWLSTYIYKSTVDNRFRMCIWDFNSSCDNYPEETQIGDLQRFELESALWYFMLTKDEDFINETINRYKSLRKRYLSNAYLEQYIDGVVAYLGPAIDRNYEVWGYMFEQEYDMLTPTDRNPRSYEESIDDLKKYLRDRTMWMDANIDSLRQYSNASRIKKFNEKAN